MKLEYKIHQPFGAENKKCIDCGLIRKNRTDNRPRCRSCYIKSQTGVALSNQTKQNMSKGHIGKKLSPEHVEKCRIAQQKRSRHPNQCGENHWNWKGGITPVNISIRMSTKYKEFRKSVFERDNYQCVIGGKEHGNKLHADHIKPFSLFPELRFDINNMRTLCIECHRKTDTYAGKLFTTYNIKKNYETRV